MEQADISINQGNGVRRRKSMFDEEEETSDIILTNMIRKRTER